MTTTTSLSTTQKSHENLSQELSILLASKISVIFVQAREPDRAITIISEIADANASGDTGYALWKMPEGLFIEQKDNPFRDLVHVEESLGDSIMDMAMFVEPDMKHEQLETDKDGIPSGQLKANPNKPADLVGKDILIIQWLNYAID